MEKSGVLREIEDVKLLILYTLSKLNRPVPTEAMVDLFLNSETVEYFSLKEAIDELIETRHIAVDPEGGVTVLTRLGYEAARELSSRLPRWACARAVRGAIELLASLDRREGTNARVYERDGQFVADCTLSDGDSLLYRLELTLPSREFAFATSENFKENAVDIYRMILKKLSGPYKDPFEKH